jgi:hypothetical protein
MTTTMFGFSELRSGGTVAAPVFGIAEARDTAAKAALT